MRGVSIRRLTRTAKTLEQGRKSRFRARHCEMRGDAAIKHHATIVSLLVGVWRQDVGREWRGEVTGDAARMGTQ
jgi:hypothetical protein